MYLQLEGKEYESTYIHYNTLLNDECRKVELRKQTLRTKSNYFIFRTVFPQYLQLVCKRSCHKYDQHSKFQLKIMIIDRPAFCWQYQVFDEEVRRQL